METNRREAVLLGAFAPLLMASMGEAQAAGGPAPGPADAIRIFRVYATPDGQSHIETVHVTGAHKTLPVKSVLVVSFAKGVEDWHHAPVKTFTINMAGNIIAQTSDGKTQAIGPGDLVYLEDVAGKGHVTHLLTSGANLFLQMPEDFDLLAWAKA